MIVELGTNSLLKEVFCKQFYCKLVLWTFVFIIQSLLNYNTFLFNFICHILFECLICLVLWNYPVFSKKYESFLWHGSNNTTYHQTYWSKKSILDFLWCIFMQVFPFYDTNITGIKYQVMNKNIVRCDNKRLVENLLTYLVTMFSRLVICCNIANVFSIKTVVF